MKQNVITAENDATTAKQNTSASRDRHIFQPKVKTKNIASTWKDATKMGLSKDFRFHNKAISLELERIMTTHASDVTRSQDGKWRHNLGNNPLEYQNPVMQYNAMSKLKVYQSSMNIISLQEAPE